MTVTVRLFASARELAGTAEACFPAEGKPLSELRQQLGLVYGEDFARLLTSCATWVNGAPAPPGTVLRANDEVVVLPPVSGG